MPRLFAIFNSTFEKYRSTFDKKKERYFSSNLKRVYSLYEVAGRLRISCSQTYVCDTNLLAEQHERPVRAGRE